MAAKKDCVVPVALDPGFYRACLWRKATDANEQFLISNKKALTVSRSAFLCGRILKRGQLDTGGCLLVLAGAERERSQSWNQQHQCACGVRSFNRIFGDRGVGVTCERRDAQQGNCGEEDCDFFAHLFCVV